jgi:hypothetical protein
VPLRRPQALALLQQLLRQQVRLVEVPQRLAPALPLEPQQRALGHQSEDLARRSRAVRSMRAPRTMPSLHFCRRSLQPHSCKRPSSTRASHGAPKKHTLRRWCTPPSPTSRSPRPACPRRSFSTSSRLKTACLPRCRALHRPTASKVSLPRTPPSQPRRFSTGSCCCTCCLPCFFLAFVCFL